MEPSPCQVEFSYRELEILRESRSEMGTHDNRNPLAAVTDTDTED